MNDYVVDDKGLLRLMKKDEDHNNNNDKGKAKGTKIEKERLECLLFLLKGHKHIYVYMHNNTRFFLVSFNKEVDLFGGGIEDKKM
jgi:hypothetical protein